ncbi:MAG TPA: hypothetical protein VK468_03345 [Pyrinomonadaceae bacterium]|nr:hypothetical protein [Pyrinomonadaceae bacterium]
MKRTIWSFAGVLLFAAGVFAQPRPVSQPSTPAAARNTAPSSFEAKYEGGMFGFTEKKTGMLKFDDANERLVFFGEDKKEAFGIPYKSLMVIYPQSQSVTSTTGNVVRNIPLPGAGLAGLIKEKRRYLVIQFDDPDVDARGVINFKLDNKDLLDSVIQSLGQKAKLTQRGDAYYRPRVPRSEI